MRSYVTGWLLLSVVLVNNAWAMYMPWPLNGKLINQSPIPVAVWDGEQGIYTIPALTQSPSLLDVDHVYVANRNQWCKIGPGTAIVSGDGALEGCSCWVDSAGQACQQTEAPTRSVAMSEVRPLRSKPQIIAAGVAKTVDDAKLN